MSSPQNSASMEALNQNKAMAQGYYGIALPALDSRMGSINASLAGGEPGFVQDAYQAQRGGITEGMLNQERGAQSQQMAGAKKALSGGNQFANMNPADIGAQLANALYGSKFQEGQANLNQSFNLMSMGLGGAGTAGNAALNASGQELNAIRMLPQYNQTYANIAGGAAGLSSIYGALNQSGAFNTQPALPMGWSSSSFVTGS